MAKTCFFTVFLHFLTSLDKSQDVKNWHFFPFISGERSKPENFWVFYIEIQKKSFFPFISGERSEPEIFWLFYIEIRKKFIFSIHFRRAK